jgi:polysaccharide biosynthesis protein PslG
VALQSHTGRRLLVALALVVISALAPVPAIAAEKGIETDLTWDISNRDRDRTVAGVRDLGAKWMRITISWNDIETAKGVYNTSHYDNAINRAVNSGAKIVATVYTAPSWASGQSDPESPPRDPADYADFMRWAATRWGDKIHAWEVWNEQNVWDFWSTGPNPAQYAELLKVAYPAIKLADPTAQVVYGGVSGNDYRFVEGSYAAVPNLGDYYDVMATHPYTPGNPPEEMWNDDEGRPHELAFATYRQVRDVMLANGDDKPLWFTEFGWSTNTVKWGVSATQQADYLTRALRCVEQDPYVEVAIWYIYRNHHWARNANTWDDQLGLLYTNFSRKPAYDAFKNYTDGGAGCTYIHAPPSPEPEAVPPPAPAPAPTPEPVPTFDSVLLPEPTPASPATEPASEPQGGVESVSVTRRVEIELVRASSVGRTANGTGPTDRTPLRVRGRVLAASRGRIDLRLKCEGRGRANWHRDVEWHLDVNRDGMFTSRIRPRDGGSCRLRAAWRAFGEVLARSPVLRFRT